MYYVDRDRSIELIKARKDHCCYGMGLGIMLLDHVYPGFPGDVRNASSFPYPVQYDLVKDIDIQKLVWDEDKTPCKQPIIDSAKRLEKMGCRAITAECGFFSYFQNEIAEAVDIPVFTSGLLQVPLIQQTIGKSKKIAILAGMGNLLTDDILSAAGIDPNSNIFVVGAQSDYECPEFDNLWYSKTGEPQAYYSKMEKQVLDICRDIAKKNTDLGAIMLECTGYQPFARAIQREFDLPVYSWSTMFDFAYSVINHRDYYGHV